MTDELGRLAGVALALSLAGCNPAPPDQTVFDDQLETLDRAAEVEEELARRAEKLGERMGNEDDEEDAPQ